MGGLHDQADFTTRFEWGAEGIHHVAPGSACAVIVDVLRFCTAVDVAVVNGAKGLPYRHADTSAATSAQTTGGRLATGSPCSLSPASLTGIPTGTRLVLPSPNETTLALLAAESGVLYVFAGCLRNTTAVATAVRRIGGTVTTDCCARASRIWLEPAPSLPICWRSFSAELRQRGLQRDIVIAADLDRSTVAPVLRSGAFTDRTRARVPLLDRHYLRSAAAGRLGNWYATDLTVVR